MAGDGCVYEFSWGRRKHFCLPPVFVCGLLCEVFRTWHPLRGGCWKAISLYCLRTSFTRWVWGFVSRDKTYALNISARNKNTVFQNVKVFIPFLSGRMSNIWGEGLLLAQYFKTVFYNFFLFSFKKKFFKLIYLAVPSLSWGTRESLFAACRMKFPDQGLNPGLPALGAWSLSHRTLREVLSSTPYIQMLG